MKPPLVQIRGLQKHFPIRRGLLRRRVGAVRAVDGVSLDIHEGETLGLVGESGSGKSTAGRAILQLIRPTDGTVRFDGRELTAMSREELRTLRRQMQMIFQDPYASLNPKMAAGSIVGEPLDVHRIGNRAQRAERVLELLSKVGLAPELADRYPHEFSGGQRQRIGIARALASRPKFIVADEPISALDVSIQAQVVNVLSDLKEELGLTYLFIAHDLAMVRHISDRIAVMYLGRIVEMADRDRLFAEPRHPYTRALLSAIPTVRPRTSRPRGAVVRGEVGDPANPPSGCRFHPRCPFAEEICRTEEPNLKAASGGGGLHVAACHLADEFDPTGEPYE